MIGAEHPMAKAVEAIELSVACLEASEARDHVGFTLDAARMILGAVEENPALHELTERARRAVDRLSELRGVAIDGDCRPILETIPLLARH